MTENIVPSTDKPVDQTLLVVSVGTDHHRFDRLVQAADSWAEAHPDARVVVQYGTSTPPVHAEGYELIPHDRLCLLFAAADVVICHGGPSTVMDARAAGRMPIVMARHPEHGEHVDFHQQEFAEHLHAHQLAHVITDPAALPDQVAAALARPEDFQASTDASALPGVVGFSRVADEALTARPQRRNKWTSMGASSDSVAGSRSSGSGVANASLPQTRPISDLDGDTGLGGDSGGHDGPFPSELVSSALRQLSDASHLDDQSVSVVIATRDRPELLRRALNSVLGQEHPDPIEVVLVFDRSEPDYSLVSHDPHRRVVVTTNERSPGLAGARNTGISHAAYPWIALCDDDDEWLDGKIAAQFEALRRQPAARAACTGIYIRYEGNDTARIPDPAKVTFEGFLQDRMTEVHPSAWLVHKETLLADVGLVDEDLPGSYAEDYDLFLRTTRSCPIAVAEAPLVRVWWHGASFFFERWKTIDEALEYLIDKYPEFHDYPKGAARIYGQRAVAQAAMGERRRALRTAWETAKMYPGEKRVPIALAIAAGFPSGLALKAAHRVGRGI